MKRKSKKPKKVSLSKEYSKLRSLLPRACKKTNLQHKVGVVDAAYHYIRHLQSALLDKFNEKGIPRDLAGVVGNKITSTKDVQALALHLINIKNKGTNQKSKTNKTSS